MLEDGNYKGTFYGSRDGNALFAYMKNTNVTDEESNPPDDQDVVTIESPFGEKTCVQVSDPSGMLESVNPYPEIEFTVRDGAIASYFGPNRKTIASILGGALIPVHTTDR